MREKDHFIIKDGKIIQFLGGAEDVIIPEDVVCIGPGAFHGYDVKSVYIPDGVLEIGNNCFNGCEKLEKVRIPKSVQAISESAFRDTRDVEIITYKGCYAWEYVQQEHNKFLTVIECQDDGSSNLKSLYISEKMRNDKEDVTALSENQSDSLEDGIQISLSKQSLKPENAYILKCKVDECPWMMRNNFLGRAKRLARRIAQITDQDLLIRIAREASLDKIKCAAIENITSQDILTEYAKHKSYKVRLSSINNLTDEDVLCDLAISDDESCSIGKAAIKKITSQDLLIRIAREVESNIIKCDAIEKITSQEVLIEFSKHKSSDVRLSSIKNLTDRVTLGNLAISDKNFSVREAAVVKVKDEKVIKKYLMEFVRPYSYYETPKSLIRKITVVKDLQELAILARDDSVRKCSVHLLPRDCAENNLLKAAAELDKKIVPHEVERFKIAVEQLRVNNPEFLKLVEDKYPSNCVRYLVCQDTCIDSESTGNMLELLRSLNPSSLRSQIEKCELFLIEARVYAANFSQECQIAARQGDTQYQMKIERFDLIETGDDAFLFAGTIQRELLESGFENVSAYRSREYSTYYEYVDGEREERREFLGYSVIVETYW